MLERPAAGTIPDTPGSYQFKDGDGRSEKRHVIRLWFRNEGRPFFDG